MLPVGSGPVASVVEPLLSVMEVALTTFQLSVTFDPGVTVLELAVKLEMVGGFEEGGASEELPPPHPEIMIVVRKNMKAAKKNCWGRVEVTCLPFRGTNSRHRRVPAACYLEAAALERVVIGCPRATRN